MPISRPISDLRNKATEIETLCHETGEPVFITKNGQGKLVVMSVAAFERDQARVHLYRLLDEAEADLKTGDRGVSVATARRRLMIGPKVQPSVTGALQAVRPRAGHRAAIG